MKRFTTILVMLALLLALPPALLAAPVGKITHIEGSVDLTVGEQVRDANLGDPVSVGDILRAKRKARAEVTFTDGNILRLAENTRIRITDYQMGEGKSSTIDLFRGKTQSVVSGLAKNARYEVHTPTAVAGVRGTNFIAFFENGVSGFVPKEGTIYGYNRTMPSDVRTVTPGQAIVIPAADRPPAVQPASSTEVDRHVSDTAPTKKPEETEKKEESAAPAAAGTGGGQAAAGKSAPTAEQVPVPTVATTAFAYPVAPTPPTKPAAVPTTGGSSTIVEPKPTVTPPPAASTTDVAGSSYFGSPASQTATGTLSGGLNPGTLSLAMQYLNSAAGPQQEVGPISGTLSDGSAFQGFLASVPGSWNGAAAAIYTLGGGAGLMMGSLSGSYDATAGKLTAGGPLNRTSIVATLDPRHPDPIFSVGGTPPGFLSASVDAAGIAKTVSVPALIGENNGMLYWTADGVLGIWAVDSIGTFPETASTFSYTNTSSPRRTSWTAKYGGVFSGAGDGESSGYFLGDVTGTESDPDHLRLTGKEILWLDEGFLGTIDLNYFANSSGKSGGVGSLQARALALNGTIYGSLKRYNSAGGDGYGSLDYIGGTHGLIGSLTNPLTGSVTATLLGSYHTDTGSYAEPALMYGSGWYVSGRIGSGTEATTDDGAYNGYIVGIWNGGAIEKARTLAIYTGSGGKTGYLYGTATGSYYGDLLLWQASGPLTAAEKAGATTSLDATSYSALGSGYFAGEAKWSSAAAAVQASLVEGALIGLKDQNPGWGIWNVGLGGTFTGTPAATFTAPIGGSIDLYSEAAEYGYWTGKLQTDWGTGGRLSATITGGRFLTNRSLGDIVTGPYGGILGTWSGSATAGTWQAAGLGIYENAERLAFSTPLDGQISKMMDGTIRSTNYTALYRLPSTTTQYHDFYASGNFYKKVGYEATYFKDTFGAVNLGYRFEQPEYIRASEGWTQGLDVRYWPNRSFFVVRSHSPIDRIIARGRASDLYPNLDLSAATPVGGTTGSHPYFPGTAGNPASFPADYAINTPTTADPNNLWGHGTFVKTTEWSYANANSREEIGTFSGILGVRGSNPMALFASSTATTPVSIALMGSYAQHATYEGIHGTLGYGSTLSSFVPTTTGYGGAYYGQIQGRLPDTGSTVPLQGSLYALYVYNPDAATNRAGILYGRLTEGATSVAIPEIGMWQADGQLYRLADATLEKDLTVAGENPAGVTAQYLEAKIVSGRGGVDGTAGFYTPTSPDDPTPALAMGRGWFPSIKGVNKFGLFFLTHDFMNYSNGTPASAAKWESAGWGEFGGYTRNDSSFYNDFGYWYATLDNKSWASNLLSANFNGSFLTLKKYGTMTGNSSGSYSETGLWGASSQGYWQKGGDLAFSSQILGNSIQLRRDQNKSYMSYGGEVMSTYSYSISPTDERDRYGRSNWYDAGTNTSTFVSFDSRGSAGSLYVKERWTTSDGGTTWSYADPVYYANEAAYNAALDGMTTPPSGAEWMEHTYGETGGYQYRLSKGSFDGILGGLNTNLWSDKASPIRLQGSFDDKGNRVWRPSLAMGELLSFNPLVNIDPWINSTAPIGGAYRGMMGVAVDSTRSVQGGLMALYQDPAGYAGILYGSNIGGSIYPEVGAWAASGDVSLYPMTTAPLTGGSDAFIRNVQVFQMDTTYTGGTYPVANPPVVDLISGETLIDKKTSSLTLQNIQGLPWGIWHAAAGGTYTGSANAPGSWTERRNGEPVAAGGTRDTYNHVTVEAPVNGISNGTVAGAQVVLNQMTSPTGPAKSYTVVQGGLVKGLFDPSTTPMTWSSISQGGFMETGSFLAKQSAMDDAAKANFERAMKIPAFDVGVASLSGNNGNLDVSISNVKFFRFQNETSPRIWATNSVGGGFDTNPYAGTTVQLSGSGDLSGLRHTFEIKQWDTGNNSWAADIYRGEGDSSGTLTRSSVDAARLPSAPAAIAIAEMRGGAAGTIMSQSIPGGPRGTFTGTAAGTVRTEIPR